DRPPAAALAEVDLEEVVAAREVGPDPGDVLVPFVAPRVLVDGEESAPVVAGGLASAIGLDVPAPALDPLADGAHGQDEPAARVLPVEEVEVRPEGQDVGECG